MATSNSDPIRSQRWWDQKQVEIMMKWRSMIHYGYQANDLDVLEYERVMRDDISRKLAFVSEKAKEEAEARLKAIQESEEERKREKARYASNEKQPRRNYRKSAIPKTLVYDDEELGIGFEEDFEEEEEEVQSAAPAPPPPTLSTFVDNAQLMKAKGIAKEFEVVESVPRVIVVDDDETQIEYSADDWQEVEAEGNVSMKTKRRPYAEVLRQPQIPGSNGIR